MFGFKTSVIFILAVLLATGVACTQNAHADPRIKRKILALYDGSKAADSADTMIHKLAEMPLNHIGLDVRYHDVRKGFPSLASLHNYRGVITWFGGAIDNGEEYLTWADRAAHSGLKFLVFSDIGAPVNDKTLPLINRFLAHLSLSLGNRFVAETFGTTVVDLDKSIIGFERPLYKVMPPYAVFVATSTGTNIHLSVSPPGYAFTPKQPRAAKQKAILVLTGPGGGFVHSAYGSHYDSKLERDKWLINPFAFFKKAFGLELFPIPDTTTLAGRRIYFSHVDGDGWNNVSLIERYRTKGVLSARVMLDELIEPYGDLPVTVGLVTGDLDASIGGNPDAADIARKIFALDQVEVGSHTHTHPFNWEFFEHYSAQTERAMIEQQAAKRTGKGLNVIKGLRGLLNQGTPRQRHQKYIAGSDDMPRAYMKKPFSLASDITGSLALARSYAPKGKKARLMQWSGNTRPFEAALRATRQAGAYNINGGDPRFDMEFPSIAYLSPLSRMVGAERQIYAAASNENTYTNDWTGPFYAFSNLTKTLDNMEKPRRLKPFNLYYHTYSAERDASLKAVKSHLNRARTGRYTPVATSQYAAIADSFFKVELKPFAPNEWTVHNRNQLQTVRFDNAQNIEPNWKKCRGIVGANRHQNSLYFALDATHKTPHVAIRPMAKNTVQRTPLSRPVLQDSRWPIEGLKYDKTGLRFEARGFGDGDMTWLGLTPGHFRIVVTRRNEQLWQGTARVGQDGRLQLNIPLNAQTALSVRIEKGLRLGSRANGQGE